MTEQETKVIEQEIDAIAHTSTSLTSQKTERELRIRSLEKVKAA